MAALLLPHRPDTSHHQPLHTCVTATPDYKEGAIPPRLTPADLSVPFTRLCKASKLCFLYPVPSEIFDYVQDGIMDLGGWGVGCVCV